MYARQPCRPSSSTARASTCLTRGPLAWRRAARAHSLQLCHAKRRVSEKGAPEQQQEAAPTPPAAKPERRGRKAAQDAASPPPPATTAAAAAVTLSAQQQEQQQQVMDADELAFQEQEVDLSAEDLAQLQYEVCHRAGHGGLRGAGCALSMRCASLHTPRQILFDCMSWPHSCTDPRQ